MIDYDKILVVSFDADTYSKFDLDNMTNKERLALAEQCEMLDDGTASAVTLREWVDMFNDRRVSTGNWVYLMEKEGKI